MRQPESVHTLDGGEWVTVRGIRRWVPTPDEVPDALPVVCSICRARADEHCKNRDGGLSNPHRARTSPRVCSCGAALGRKRTYCDDCRPNSASQARKARYDAAVRASIQREAEEESA